MSAGSKTLQQTGSRAQTGWFMPWRQGFQRSWLPRDLVAGIALGVVMVPQGMAYATLAGLPPETGLYATMAAIVGYALLGSSRQLVVGPDSSTSTILASALVGIVGAGAAVDVISGTAAAIALLAGGILILAGFLKAGIIANFISKPVLTGYLNALAVTILIDQAPKILGFDVSADGVIPKAFDMVRRLGEAQWLPVTVGAGCLAIIFLLKRFLPQIPGALVAVAVALVVSAVLDLESEGLSVVGQLPAGLPSISVPVDAFSEFGLLLLPAFAVAVMGFADTTVTSTVFAERGRYRVDANKDLMGLGAASSLSGLAGGLTVSASDSRTAVADTAGGRSQVANLVGAAVIGIILVFFATLLAPLPSAALAAVVISAGLSLFDFSTFRAMAHQNRTDFWTGVVAFVGALALGLLPGIVVAVVLSLFNILMSAARTELVVLARSEVTNVWRNQERFPDGRQVPGLLVVRWESALFFGNAGGFAEQVKNAVLDSDTPIKEVLFDAEATSYADFTGTEALRGLITHLDGEGVDFAAAEVNGRLMEALTRSGNSELIGSDRIYASVDAGAMDFIERTPGVEVPTGEAAAEGGNPAQTKPGDGQSDEGPSDAT